MHTLVRTVFSKLHTLDPEEEEAKLLTANEDDNTEVELRMSVTPKESKFADDEPLVEPEPEPEPSAPADSEKDEEEPKKPTLEEIIPQTPISFINRPECMFGCINFNCYGSLLTWCTRRPSFNTGIAACPSQCP